CGQIRHRIDELSGAIADERATEARIRALDGFVDFTLTEDCGWLFNRIVPERDRARIVCVKFDARCADPEEYEQRIMQTLSGLKHVPIVGFHAPIYKGDDNGLKRV